MAAYNDEFLRDLAQLLTHGRVPLSQLVQDLVDPVRREELVQALNHLGEIASSGTSGPKRRGKAERKPAKVKMPLDKDAEPERYDMLKGAADLLLQSEIFQDRKNLAALAVELGIPVNSRDSRVAIVQKVLIEMANLNTLGLQGVTNRIRESVRGSRESFEELARFITRGYSTR